MTKADKRLIIPGDDEKPTSEDSRPTIVLQEGIREITATTLAEEHQGLKQIHDELQSVEGAEDWGDGFTAFPEPAHILRGPDGAITSVVPFSEIQGVAFVPGKGFVESGLEPTVAKESRPTPVVLSRDSRHKLVSILAKRMFLYYQQLPRDYPGFHPFRDGIPDLPAGSPKNLTPDLNTLFPASDSQIYDWLYKFVGARATVVNKNRFGAGHQTDIADLALHIE